MSIPKVGMAQGTCRRCGRTYRAKRPVTPNICDCHKICPLCGREMQPYTPDLTALAVYDGGLDVYYACYNHTPPYLSRQKPVEVELT